MPRTAPAALPQLDSILAELDRALASVRELVPLDDERFLEAHSTFEACSDQRQRIIAWLQEHIRTGAADPSDRPRTLSIGCGDGAVDVPAARAISDRHERQLLVGVDPNDAELAEFGAAFDRAAIPGLEHELHAMTFDDFESEHRFDNIHCVHSLYYMPDPRRALRRALGMLSEQGELVLFHAPCAELNSLAVRFYDKYYRRPTMFAEDFAAALEADDHGFRRERLDARIDVTAMTEGDDPDGIALRDFIVQFDCRRLPADVLEQVDRYLEAITHREDGKAWIAHSVDAFVVPAA